MANIWRCTPAQDEEAYKTIFDADMSMHKEDTLGHGVIRNAAYWFADEAQKNRSKALAAYQKESKMRMENGITPIYS